jgi:DNA-binding LacI/PurR family transcriptional regulator
MASKPASLPLYQQIYDKLIEDVNEGRLKPGDRLPSENELSQRFDVSRITSKRALEMLSNEGRVERVPGKGTFLSEAGMQASGIAAPVSARVKLIGLVIPQFGDEFGATLTRSIEANCRELGYQVVLCLTYESQKLEEEAIEKLLALGVSGILILPVHGEFYNPIILRLVLNKFPLVFVDRRLRGLEASAVSSDNIAAAKAATDYLLDKGHRVLGFVSRQIANSSTLEDRLEGFCRSHIEHGVSIDKSSQILERSLDLEMNIEGQTEAEVQADLVGIRGLLENNPDITAVFAAEYSFAVATQKAMAELGKNLDIVCFDEPNRPRRLLQKEIAYVQQPELQIGREAVRILRELIDGTKSDIEDVRLEASFMQPYVLD